MRIYDITQPLSNQTVVWPGDPPVHVGFRNEQSRGDMVTIGEIAMGLHSGTHVDAPYHYDPAGHRMGAYGLTPFIGDCAVIAITPQTPTIDTESLREAWEASGLEATAAKRVLLHTRTSRGAAWTDDYAYLTPDAVGYLASLGCVLVGIDSPTYDPPTSTSLDAHHALAAAGIANLENLVLDDVPPGRYTLLALPLALPDMEAAPVRAVLLEARLSPA